MVFKRQKPFAVKFLPLAFLFVFACILHLEHVEARNITTYSDTLSDSAPFAYSNHTIEFTVGTDIAPSAYIEFVPPPEFEIVTAVGTSSFSARNVELYVNNVPRAASSTGDATTDEITITPGTPGSIRYTFNPTTGVASGDVLRLLIGNQTAASLNGETVFSTSTGTTTNPIDISGVQNASTTGSHRYTLVVSGAGQPIYADFILALVNKVDVGPVDTTETIPPVRFNGRPTGDVGGTTLGVELSLETDEFAVCRYSTTASTSYFAMTDTFENTGLIVHSEEISDLMNETTYTFYVRCIDDEGNYNTDDYAITFTILDVPEGDPNTEGDVEGDGSGSGDADTGGGEGSGGSSGSSNADSSTSGGSSGGGGSSGSSGNGGTGDEGSQAAGGGFEPVAGEYPSGDATVNISGYAFPRSDISILVDGVLVETGSANTDGRFSVTLEEIARGVYTFGVYATDDNNIKSTTFSTSFSVQGGKTSNLTNVNIMPSILVSPDPADIGDTITISGYSIRNAVVTIEHQKENSQASRKTLTADSDSSGRWSIELDTDRFDAGTYKVRAKAEQSGGISTGYSDYTYYGVGQESDVELNSDLNRDGRVNLTDFSILLFWWGSDGGSSNPPADINQDGDVSLTDFSILLFNWTG